MTNPPRLAMWLLEASLASSERDAVIGDLCEEFRGYVVPTRGGGSARRWFRWQVARSLPLLFFRAWQRASLERASAAVVSGAALAALPAGALLMLRTFVLQQVPLKTTSELSTMFATALLVVLLAAGGVGFAAAVHILNGDSRER